MQEAVLIRLLSRCEGRKRRSFSEEKEPKRLLLLVHRLPMM
jgi:hypothetical protein